MDELLSDFDVEDEIKKYVRKHSHVYRPYTISYVVELVFEDFEKSFVEFENEIGGFESFFDVFDFAINQAEVNVVIAISMK